MSEFAFQLDNEQKWIGVEDHYFYTDLSKNFNDVVDKVLAKGGDLPVDVKEHLARSKEDIEKSMKEFLNFKHYVNFIGSRGPYTNEQFQTLTTKAATRLNISFISSTSNLQEIINKQKEAVAILSVIKTIVSIHMPLFQVKLSKSEMQGYNSNFYELSRIANSQWQAATLKALDKLEKKLEKGEIKAVERNTENRFIRKTAWAIFQKQSDEISGFKGKNGELGDISIARLFDSDKGANKTARAMSLTSYDIVEVDVSLKKRMNINPDFADKNLDAALVILEREKIEQFFKEIPLQDIENRLEEEKIKKRNKI